MWANDPRKLYPNKLASTSMLRLGLAVSAAAIFALPGWAGCSTPPEKAHQAKPPIAVRTAAVRQGTMEERLDYVGTIRAGRQVRVLAQIPGTLGFLESEGSPVQVGNPVARVLAPELQARQTRTRAELQRAITERDFLCDKLLTDKSLHQAGALPASMVDASQRGCSAAEAAADAGAAGLREVQSQTTKGTERAPFSGQVLSWLAEPGQNVMPGMPLMVLGDQTREVRVNVAEYDAQRGVRSGSPVVLELDGQQIRTQIREIAPIAAGPARTVEVRIDLPPEQASTARPGASIRVGLVHARLDQALNVPTQALRSRDDHSSVFVVEGDRVRAIRVKPGLTSKGRVAVQGELKAGSTVAVSNLDALEDGTQVYPVATKGD